MNTIFIPKSRDTQINHQSICSHFLTERKICKTNPISLQTVTKNMQNKPNFNQTETRDERPTTKKMQNKPNFTTNASSPTSPNGPQATSHDLCKTNPISKTSKIEYQESSIENMQNEPNFIPKLPTKHANGTNFTPKKSLFLINSYTHLLIYSTKARTFRRFSQLLHTNILMSLPNKDLHNFFTPKYGPRVTRDESRLKCKTNPISPQPHICPPRPTDHGARVTSHDLFKTNPISTKNVRNYCNNKDLRKFLHPALPGSANNQLSIINNQLKRSPLHSANSPIE